MKNFLCLLFLAGFLTGCSYTTQSTSGRTYLAKYQNVSSGRDGEGFDEKIRRAASVEPTLTFPARIGIAYIENGRLQTLSGQHVEVWKKVEQNIGKGFGEFVPVNPMIAHMVSKSFGVAEGSAYDVMETIRLGAARQHLDAVFVYEAYSRSDLDGNFLSVADLTIIGAFILPSKKVEVEGFASALLIDVMQGYPYGTVDASVDKEKAYTSTAGSFDRAEVLSEIVKDKAVEQLALEAEKMFLRLRTELKKTEG